LYNTGTTFKIPGFKLVGVAEVVLFVRSFADLEEETISVVELVAKTFGVVLNLLLELAELFLVMGCSDVKYLLVLVIVLGAADLSNIVDVELDDLVVKELCDWLTVFVALRAFEGVVVESFVFPVCRLSVVL